MAQYAWMWEADAALAVAEGRGRSRRTHDRAAVVARAVKRTEPEPVKQRELDNEDEDTESDSDAKGSSTTTTTTTTSTFAKAMHAMQTNTTNPSVRTMLVSILEVPLQNGARMVNGQWYTSTDVVADPGQWVREWVAREPGRAAACNDAWVADAACAIASMPSYDALIRASPNPSPPSLASSTS